MPVPSLINPIKATIQSADTTTTPYDRDTREPIRTVRRVTESIDAQVAHDLPRDFAVWGMGPAEDVRGYLVVRKKDVDAASYVPSRGDRITKLGHRATALYVLQVVDFGHHGDTNGSSLFLLTFGDRRPTSDAPTM